MDLRSMRWLTVAPPDQPGVEILLEQPGAPFMDADAVEQHRSLTPKGMAPAVFLEVDDCRAKFDAVVATGVEVVQEPVERFYGVDAAIRADSGNHLRLTQRART